MASRQRYAANRGSCVYRGGSRVRWLWPCGCRKTEIVLIGPRGCRKPMAPELLAKLEPYWRSAGVNLPPCKKHPDWYSRESQVARLNAENPQSSADSLEK